MKYVTDICHILTWHYSQHYLLLHNLQVNKTLIENHYSMCTWYSMYQLLNQLAV